MTQEGQSARKKEKTPYEKALDERYGEGFSDMLKKDKTCPKCSSLENVTEGDCPECHNSIRFCMDCEEFF